MRKHRFPFDASRLPGRLFLLCLWTAPVVAQNPPAGRELPTVCSAGTCTGGVSQWAASGPGAPARSVNGTRMVIRQPRQRELYNWATFDVAKGHSVEFDQAFGDTAVALNRVLGNANPQSLINGTVKAPGEVYVINQNGIVFGADARVNVHSLTASSLRLWNDQEFLSGGLTAAIAKTTGEGVPAPEAAFDHDFAGAGESGAVEVRRGARIESAEGGRVLLVAPKVTNAGSIATPGGQTVLAGSYDKVYVAASNDPNLRGLVVEVGTGGQVDNVGELIAERGNVSLVGLAVNQDGLARATTAVNFNGSVRLAARHKTSEASIVNQSGNVTINSNFLETTPDAGDPLQEFGVTLGAGSVTEVVPESASDDAAIDASTQRLSQVSAFGKRITLERDARIAAAGGEVALRAVSGAVPGEVVLEQGASIDVSGTDDTVLPMSANVGRLELRGNELADFPLQRDGVLRGREVAFDLRRLRFVENDATSADDDQYFLPIGNVTAAATSVRRGVGERLAEGGSVSIEADRVDLQRGSTIDFSGGKVSYEPGFLETSMLISEGRVFDIHDAPADLVYDAVLPYFDVEYARWGVTDRFNVFGEAYTFGRFEPGYAVGFDAGSLSIRATTVNLDGRLLGGVTRGRLQRNATTDRLAGRLRFANEIPLAGLFELGFVDSGSGVPVGPAGIRLGAQQADEQDIALVLGDALFADGGINRVRVVSGGVLRIGDFALAPGGELVARGGATELTGAIEVPAGAVEIETIQPPTLRPALNIAASARIDVSGQWTNDSELLNPDGPTAPLWRDGGSVRLLAEGDLTLAAGSVIDVSGGAQFTDAGAIVAGAPGTITLRSVVDAAEVTSSRLTLDGELRGFGLAQGAALELVAGGFVVGAAPAADGFARTVLNPAFFSRGGFASFTLDARGGLDSIDDVLIEFAAGADV
ncbi:MAG: filamentous hemagglutinin N-terminal domain-containing protein, partial [Gammaproteobacteria bacterium]